MITWYGVECQSMQVLTCNSATCDFVFQRLGSAEDVVCSSISRCLSVCCRAQPPPVLPLRCLAYAVNDARPCLASGIVHIRVVQSCPGGMAEDAAAGQHRPLHV